MKRSFAVRVLAGVMLAATLAVGPAAAAGPVPAAHVAAAGKVTPAACTPGRSACPIKIVFANGAYSAQASSHLSGPNSVKYFSFKAKKNQELVVWVIGAGPTRGVLTFANGASDGQPGGRVFDGRVPATGRILVRVTEDTMAQAWSGKVTVLVVAI
jgi:hypothetical protein